MKYSMLPAMSVDGILHLEIFDKAITGDDFRRFVQGLLPHMNNWPLPKSVLVFDNALIHRVPDIREMVEERGARLLCLPAHSPDLNPIDLAFPTIKTWLHTNRDRVNQAKELDNGAVRDVFWEAARSITAEQAKKWYEDCGYIVPGV
jgi:transposase